MFRSGEALASYLADPARMLDDVRLFEEEVHTREGGRWAVGVNSATSGLLAALLALGVQSGDEVIVPALSWGQTWTGALILGCRLVAVDLAKDWPVVDPKGVAAASSPRTRAVVSVGLWGSPAGLAEVDAVCKRRGIPHVVDAAQLLGTRIGGQKIGELGKSRYFGEKRSPGNCDSMKQPDFGFHRNDGMGDMKVVRDCVKIGEAGDLVVLSLGPSKSFSCGEGGMVLVRKDAVLRDRLLWLTQHPYRVHSEAENERLIETARDGVGFNLRLHPLAARAGLRFLKYHRRTIRKHMELRRIVGETAARHGLRSLRLPARFKPVRVQSHKALLDAQGVGQEAREAFREEISGFATSLPCTYRPLSVLSLSRRQSFLPWAPRPERSTMLPQRDSSQACRWASDMEIVTFPILSKNKFRRD